MRIIGGEFKSRILADFAGDDVRPTSDRAREALFNILARKVPLARVLDLFSGSGALGIESLSRGAKEVVFNDAAKDSVALLKKNLTTLKLISSERVQISNRDYSVCLDYVTGKFDIIFLDPPYRFDYGKTALEKIARKGLLSDDGVIVYERDRAFEGEIAGLEKYDERKYGKAIFTFFRREV
ncbi:MAG: 16S rRNA (guanine(966)-N(2))-methyltransferase RsmD [Clostridiales bacterium]|nr:16S rRNA (guanine(966)-N(2))-methyltransferase RsmD [Clostridiales bacterium]